ncbi:MAG: GYD domain-containing protein [Chloroflexi bacterium]|nr:GYD domain-containing protein [Chloroflexota bacterium]
MAHYLIRASYTQAGIQGVLKDGGSGRLTAIEALVKSVGGSVESCYWALGDDDILITVELPDNIAAAAVAATVGATGAASVRTTVLLTAADVDAAVAKHPEYRAPGT